MTNGKGNTYVGDYFNLSFLKSDDTPLKIYDGYRVKLLGFKKAVKAVLPHQVNNLTKEPGFYETIGNPLLKLDGGNVIELPMLNLVPQDYRFTDRLIKNQLYLDEIRKFKYVAELPHIPYNIGDKVLVSHHGLFKDDFISEILDITFKGHGVFYVVCPNDQVVEIQYKTIIDVIEQGELSELDRLGRLHRCYEGLSRGRISRFNYADDENNEPYTE